MLLPRCSVNQLNSFSSADCSGYLVMADIALYEMLRTFSIIMCCYGNWNQISSYWVSEYIDDIISTCFNKCHCSSFPA